MQIIFEKIRWKNFLSTGNTWTEINLNKYNTMLFVGANGAGKSTILDALCFCLFNKPFRNINKPQLKNSINKKNTLVEVEFSSGKDKFLIRRGMSPNVFEIIKNDKLIDQSANNRDYQDVLEKYYLKMNYKTFKQVVVLGSASFTPFMQLAAAHRREVIEDLLDIQIFSSMNILLKQKILDNNSDIEKVNNRLQVINGKIKLHESHIRSMSEDIDQTKKEYEQDIENLNRDKEIEENLLVEFQNNLKQLEYKNTNSKEKKLSTIRRIIEQLEDKAKRLEKEKKFYLENDNCPTCNQIIDVLFKNETIEQKSATLDKTNEALEELRAEQRETIKELDVQKEINNKINDLNFDIQTKKQKIASISADIEELENKIKNLLQKKLIKIDDNQDSKLLDMELSEASTEKRKFIEIGEIYKTSAYILKDNGIKSKIIKQYIPVINKLINKYLSQMDFFAQFEINETFNETIRSRFRDEFSYNNFSEGEKAKIDLALLFTWRAISKMRNSASTNILILDEVFSSSLDSDSSAELLKILLDLSKDNNILIISHRTEQLADKVDITYKFEKKKNFSSITVQ